MIMIAMAIIFYRCSPEYCFWWGLWVAKVGFHCTAWWQRRSWGSISATGWKYVLFWWWQKSWCFSIIFDDYLSQLFDRVKICPLLMMKENVDEFPFSIWWLFVSTDRGWDPRKLWPWNDQEGGLRYRFCVLYRVVFLSDYIELFRWDLLSVRIS